MYSHTETPIGTATLNYLAQVRVESGGQLVSTTLLRFSVIAVLLTQSSETCKKIDDSVSYNSLLPSYSIMPPTNYPPDMSVNITTP